MSWSKFRCPVSELNLDLTLNCGQSFRWRKLPNSNPAIWCSVLFDTIWKLRRISDEEIEYQLPCIEEGSEANTHLFNQLYKYFRLDVSLCTLYRKWSKADPHLAKFSSRFPGIRMLNQNPVENLFSFICSSNNNITRISSMIESMCSNYGDFLGNFDGLDYYNFPSIKTLAQEGVEEKLRALGFGYRARFIHSTAKELIELGGENWLSHLRDDCDYAKAKESLLKLPGVGPKVADCVCLMSLNKLYVVPVDTHVWQFTSRYYLPELKKHKSLTNSVYKNIGDHFRKVWGEYAGWAHSILFTAELKQFQENAKPTRRKRTKKTEPDTKSRKKKSSHIIE